MRGKITVTSSGYDPTLPPYHPNNYDPTLGPPTPRAWTAGEIATLFASYPADTPVVGFGENPDGRPTLVPTLVITTREKMQKSTADQPTTCLVISPVEKD